MKELDLKGVLEGLTTRGCCIGAVRPREYHAWKPMLEEVFGCPVVSKSSLGDFMESPYRYHYNVTHGVRKESAALRMGSMIDCMALTPDLWAAEYAEAWSPGEERRVQLKKDGTPYADKRQDAEQKAAWDAARAAFDERCEREGLTILKEGEPELVRAIAGQVTGHLEELGLRLGETFDSQVGMWMYVDKVDGVMLPQPLIVTGMIDICPRGDSRECDGLWDLKSTSRSVENAEQLFYAIEDLHYGLHVLYLDLYNTCTGESRDSFGFLFVQTVLPAMSRAVRMGAAELEVSRREYKQALVGFSHCWASGDWGSPMLGTKFYVPTAREARRLAMKKEQ
ncbi:MAG: hypothetical protein IJN29_05405 [Akkermansia sp.]|nr:hypothetical protein [Akkermansia sp.]